MSDDQQKVKHSVALADFIATGEPNVLPSRSRRRKRGETDEELFFLIRRLRLRFTRRVINWDDDDDPHVFFSPTCILSFGFVRLISLLEMSTSSSWTVPLFFKLIVIAPNECAACVIFCEGFFFASNLRSVSGSLSHEAKIYLLAVIPLIFCFVLLFHSPFVPMASAFRGF